MEINKYKKEILKVLLRGGWFNTTQIAREGKMNWNTAFKYLQGMYNLGWLNHRDNYWQARR